MAKFGIISDEPTEKEKPISKYKQVEPIVKKDYVDYGVIDRKCGEKKSIHGHFDSFLKGFYYDKETDCLSFEDFYMMSEQFFQVKGLPVLFRDILYQLMGYFYAVTESPEESVNFYARLIKENASYSKNKEKL